MYVCIIKIYYIFYDHDLYLWLSMIMIVGNEAGRDCSGRGNCDYKSGLCKCYKGFHGAACNKQSITY